LRGLPKVAELSEGGTSERNEATVGKWGNAKIVTARSARSDPQARTINKWRQTPNKKEVSDSEHLIGVCGAQRWLRFSITSAS